MTPNPFADPNAIWRNGIRVKDIKLQPQPRAPPASASQPSGAASGAFRLEELADCYRIVGVPYRSETGTYDLSKSLLATGEHKPLADWISYSVQARSRGDYEVPSAPLQYALIRALYLHREEPAYREGVERIRTFMKEVLDRTWVWTLSKAIYAPNGVDRAIHEVGLPTEFSVDAALVGPDEWVKGAPASAPVYPAVWSDTPANIQVVYQWLSGKDAYLYRVKYKPEKKADERGVACGVNVGRFILNAHNNLDGSRPAFGVRRAKNFQRK